MTDHDRPPRPDPDDPADDLPPDAPAEGVVDAGEPDPTEPQEPG